MKKMKERGHSAIFQLDTKVPLSLPLTLASEAASGFQSALHFPAD